MKLLVDSMETQLEFQLQHNTTGQELFDEALRVLMIREVWFFGLLWRGASKVWLRMDKKVSLQVKQLVHELKAKDKRQKTQATETSVPPRLHLLIRYFPEEADLEVIHEHTLKLLYLQVKEAVLKGEIKTSTQTAVLLASYAAVVSLGPFQERFLTEKNVFKEEMVPKSALEEGKLSEGELMNQTLKWFSEHKLILREDAMKEYLKVVQELEMYGVEYYRANNKKGTQLWLGVHAHGLTVYDYSNKETPKIALRWAEIHHLYSKNKKFMIRTLDQNSPLFCLYTLDKRTTQQILSTCIGNHALFVKKRRSSFIATMQHLKTLAELERKKKLQQCDIQSDSLTREVEARKKIEEEQKELKRELKDYQNYYEKALQELQKFKEKKRLQRESMEKADPSMQQKAHEAVSKDSTLKLYLSTLQGLEKDARERVVAGGTRMSEEELKALSEELQAVRERTQEVRKDMSHQEASFLVASLFRKHRIVDDDDNDDQIVVH